MAELSVKIISAPNKINKIIIGNNQNFFLTFKKFHISFKKLAIIPPKLKLMFHIVRIEFTVRNNPITITSIAESFLQS